MNRQILLNTKLTARQIVNQLITESLKYLPLAQGQSLLDLHQRICELEKAAETNANNSRVPRSYRLINTQPFIYVKNTENQ